MPVEIKDWKEFVEISGRAIECRVKQARKGDVAKIKARTRRVLYTIKVDKSRVEELVKELKCKKIVFVDTGEVREVKK
ncbi:MAG: 60S ribosomal protein L38 [Desulfurococcales archaeon]|nr:60S ribosomal protein L38 [Desulfurococcales archaeon]